MDLEFDHSEELLDFWIVELCSGLRGDILCHGSARSDGIRCVSGNSVGRHLLGEFEVFSQVLLMVLT